MKATATIACARAGHNRPRVPRPPRLPRLPTGPARLRGPAALLLVILAGCATTEPQLAEVPVWQLAHAEPAKLQSIGRARISHDRPLPPHLTQRLCDEFSLITITDQADWTDVRRLLHMDDAPHTPDLSQGAIVGLLAEVGESATGAWPIALSSVRTQSGEGWLEADFAAGLYHPVVTAGYLELVYVPGLRTIRRVEVGPRAFVIRSHVGSH